MTSADSPDTGLLAPGVAGSAAEAATGDAAFLQAMLDAEAALTRAWCAAGQAPDAVGEAVTAAARADAFDVRDLALRARAHGNPVIPLVAGLRAGVQRAHPEAAAFVHRGATSQDVLDTAVMLMAARTLRLVVADLARTADALARLAAAHRDTPMAGRTLTQQAVPTTFGLKAAGWRHLVLDAHDRLAALLDGGLPAQLGGAAGTLAAFGEHAAALPGHFAAETALAEPLLPWHTLRTPVADLAGALTLCTGALGKIAADVLVLTRTETGEVAEATGGGSSAMPHKANPVRAVLLASAARRAPGLAAVLQQSLAAEDERPAGAWHAEWEPLRDLLRLAGGGAAQAAELTAGLRVFPDRMRQNLQATGGLVTSERVAAALAEHLGRSRARTLLESAARHAADKGLPLHEALSAEPEATRVLGARRPAELTDPAGYLGEAPALTDRALRRTAREVPA